MDSVWIVYEVQCRRGTYVVRPFNGYYAGPQALLIRAPTKRMAVEIYKTLK
jgi:hypothetical protein